MCKMRSPVVFAAFALLLSSLTQPATAEPPNIVLFIADDHGYLDTSLATTGGFHTPNLERLAHEGMSLTHVFAASPTCAPSRAAFLTGLMPIHNGSMWNHQPPRPDVKKLPAYMKELGYEVVAIGKVAHYQQGRDYGFDYTSHDTFHDDACISAAVEYLQDRKSTKPLCLLVGTNWPHVPWPEADTRSSDAFKATASTMLPSDLLNTPATRHWRARYATAVERCDRDLGLIYEKAFERLGDNTLFIEFSDQGAQWPFGKWDLYDTGIRTNMFAVWPGKIKAGSRCDALISLVDLLPTLIEAAGGRPLADIDGQSFMEVLRGEKSKFRELIFSSHSGDGKMNAYPIRSVRTERWKYIRNLRPDAEHHSHIDLGKPVDGREYWDSWVQLARTDSHAAKVVNRYLRRPAEELYDLGEDPLEEHNLREDPAHESELSQLRAKLSAWMKENGDEGLESETAAAKAMPDALPKSGQQ